MHRLCRRCGRPFETDRGHHRFCWDCYWEERDGGQWSNGRTKSGRQEPPPWEAPSTKPLELDPRLLRDAISLTHPDRHPPERSRTANAVTAALLELLRNVEEIA